MILQKKLNFDVKTQGRKSTRDSSLMKLIKSPAIIALGISITIFIPSDLDELCHKLTLLLHEKQAGNNSNVISEETIAIVIELLEYRRLSKKQHKQILIKPNIIHK